MLRAAVRIWSVAPSCILGLGLITTPAPAIVPIDSQPPPATNAFVEQFEQNFAIAVLDEDCRQSVFKTPDGISLKTGPYVVPPPQSTIRHTRSEILLMWRGQDGWLARRRMLSTDGRNPASTSAGRLEVLASAGVDRLLGSAVTLPQPAPLLKIGAAVPVFDFPIWPIALLDPSERARSGFAVAHVSGSADHVRLDAQHGDVETQMSLTLDSQGRLIRAEVTARLQTGVATVSAEFETNRQLKLIVPRKMSERYQHGLETATTEIVYSNVRPFDSSGSARR